MTLQSVFALGSIVGIILMPMVSDLKGRKVSVLVGLSAFLLGGSLIFIGILKAYHLLIGFGMFLSAFGGGSLAGVTYSINSDFYSDDMRQKAVILYCAAWYVQ